VREGNDITQRVVVSVTLSVWLLSMNPTPTAAAPGDLDPTFGGFGSGGKIEDVGFDVLAMAIHV